MGPLCILIISVAADARRTKGFLTLLSHSLLHHLQHSARSSFLESDSSTERFSSDRTSSSQACSAEPLDIIEDLTDVWASDLGERLYPQKVQKCYGIANSQYGSFHKQGDHPQYRSPTTIILIMGSRNTSNLGHSHTDKVYPPSLETPAEVALTDL